MDILLVLLFFYSFLCASDVILDNTSYSDSPEYAFMYLVGCIVLGVTTIPIWYRLYRKICK